MYVKGVGPARAAMLEAKGLKTVEDLLTYAPFRYEDRSNVKRIDKLAPGEMATVLAEVRTTRMSGFRRRGLGMFVQTGARERLLAAEREKFLSEQWPRIEATIRRLGLTPEELLAAVKGEA